jgi:hypothetical protein
VTLLPSRWWSSVPARLVLSHALALLLAVGAGLAYGKSRPASNQSFVIGIAQQPLTNAADLAFQFGSVEHARIVLEERERTPSESSLAVGDTMVFELRLAVLNGEPQNATGDAPHLTAASVACKRFRDSSCERADMIKLAAKFAAQRRR